MFRNMAFLLAVGIVSWTATPAAAQFFPGQIIPVPANGTSGGGVVIIVIGGSATPSFPVATLGTGLAPSFSTVPAQAASSPASSTSPAAPRGVGAPAGQSVEQQLSELRNEMSQMHAQLAQLLRLLEQRKQ
jgi:hypothetical protein